MDTIRMKVLKEFSRNVGGTIVTGNPDHPDEEGRILLVSPEVADVLERDKQAKPYSFRDEAREEAAREKGEADEGEHEPDEADPDESTSSQGGATRTTDLPGKPKAAKQVREERVKPRGNPRRGKRSGGPVGGSETNSTVNNPRTALGADGVTSSTNAGAHGDPDADAAPTS